MGLFAKEKDTLLKVVNAILIIGTIISLLIMVATGIKLIYKEKIVSYDEYAKTVCTIDKLEYECVDEDCIKELDTERKKTCTNYYLQDKKEKETMNKSYSDNFIISLATTIVLFVALRILNKKL